MFFSEKIILDASMETAYIDFSFSLTFRGSGLRKISVPNTNELSKSQPGILLSSVSVMPSPSISSSLGSISAIPSPSVSNQKSELSGKSSTRSGRPSLSLSFNPRYWLRSIAKEPPTFIPLKTFFDRRSPVNPKFSLKSFVKPYKLKP